MYKTIKVDGNDYKLQYSVEAAMYDECTAKVITLMTAIGDEKEDEENLKSKIKEISSIPNLAVSMFYAALLQHHGTEAGDGTVRSISGAKNILARYILENDSDFFSVVNMLLEQMGEDGFFKLIGLEKMMQSEEEQKKEMTEKN